jgi:hypothetical protein
VRVLKTHYQIIVLLPHSIQHYEFEKARDVHEISMMKRAMGGFGEFSAMSPTVLLKAVKASARGSALSRQDISASSEGTSQYQASNITGSTFMEPSYFKSFDLLGQAIPHRAGLDPPVDPHASSPEINHRVMELGASTGVLSREACLHLPPTVIMSSCSDHMVRCGQPRALDKGTMAAMFQLTYAVKVQPFWVLLN